MTKNEREEDSMTIGEKIKQLRQKNNITQEKLAEYLNITYQSISKWENNNALPDISLVVPLANFFGVSIDELFDRDAEIQSAEIAEYDKKALRLANQGFIAERIALWREAVQKYPRNFHCLRSLANALFGTMYSAGFEKEQERNAKELIAICERILKDCTENNIRNSAIQLLVYTYSNRCLSIKDEKKAVEYANMAGNLYTCRNVLLGQAYYTEEGEKKALAQQHQNNLAFMDMLSRNIYLGDYASPEEVIFACETAIKLWTTLIYDGNFLFYHCRMREIYCRLAKNHAKLYHRNETLESLKNALEHAQKNDGLPVGEQPFTSAFVSLATSDKSKSSKNYKESETELVFQELKSNVFDFLRDDIEFLELSK